jgi:aspartate/methionine/tyrosine aminotransferase
MLQPLIQPGVQMVVVNFPHNPTGTTIQQQDWQQLVAACKAAGAWLFSDEMYRFTGRCRVTAVRLQPVLSRTWCIEHVICC